MRFIDKIVLILISIQNKLCYYNDKRILELIF